MKIVRLKDNVVVEVLPESLYDKGIEYWYGPEFAATCVEAPDDVKQGMIYDEDTKTFSFPQPLEPGTQMPTLEERLEVLESAMLELILGGVE